MKKDAKENIKKDQVLRGREAGKWMNELWEELLSKLANIGTKSEIRKILESLISDYEKKVILKRLAIIASVRMGKSYQEISEILWLSPNTISAIKKNILRNNQENYQSYRRFYGGPRKYSQKSRVSKSFLKELFGDLDIWDVLINPPRPRGIGLMNSAGIPKRPWDYQNKGKRK